MFIKGSINVSLIDKAQLIQGQKGKYLPFVMYENDEPDQYGNTHVIKFDLSKEAKDAGEKPKIIGNAKTMGAAKPAPKPAAKPQPKPRQPDPDLDAPADDDSGVPF